MSILKKLGLMLSAAALCLSFSVMSASAQPGKAGWKNNNGKHKGWSKGNRNGWDKGRKTGWQNNNSDYWRNRRNRNVSYNEYRRLQNQRYRLNRVRSRVNSDGYISDRERQRLNRKYNKYRRSVYKARRN